MVGAAPALDWRRAADADGDGAISERETRSLGERARVAVAAGLLLTVDGTRVAPAFEPPVVGLAGDGVAPSPLSVDLVARIPFKSGSSRHALVVDDAVAEPMLGETEIRVAESPLTTLLSSHRGPSGDEKETTFKFRGQKFSALEDRSVTVTFTQAPRVAPRRGKRSWPWWLPLGLGIGIGIGLLLRRYLKT
jgi:hypothetical protein